MNPVTNPVKPGIKTSEFITTVVGSVAVALVAFGITTVDVTDALTKLIATALAGASAIFTIGWMVVEFMKGRTDLKQLMVEKNLLPADVPVPTPDPIPVEVPAG